MKNRVVKKGFTTQIGIKITKFYLGVYSINIQIGICNTFNNRSQTRPLGLVKKPF
ncbi:MAG: hypothetical protein BAJATHORv1_10348 [Candidatus Thorarchaeota archaeon]|nr:MAG: hypothetical protein BAJATHORv1_10348 [Candidatus Thorarchaeota archaeon]